MNIYNEIEPYAASWVRNLVKANQIADGEVSGDSIKDLQAADVANAVQFHAFAGIGGWSYALRLAGWPDDQPVWTGSCPCQPFSGAGRRGGFDDERHLWPEWFRLIKECRPSIVFGEQVANPDGLKWFDLVSSDLENEGYAVGAADLCAAGVGAPHIRQRLYFVAIADPQRRDGEHALLRAATRGQGPGALPEAPRSGATGELGDARRERGGRNAGTISGAQGESETERIATRCIANESVIAGPWSNAEWLHCRDGKARPVEPGTFPLVNGFPARVGKLRAYGNAIVPQVAATFIRACFG